MSRETHTLPVLDPGRRRRSHRGWLIGAYLLVLVTAVAVAVSIP